MKHALLVIPIIVKRVALLLLLLHTNTVNIVALLLLLMNTVDLLLTPMKRVDLVLLKNTIANIAALLLLLMNTVKRVDLLLLNTVDLVASNQETLMLNACPTALKNIATVLKTPLKKSAECALNVTLEIWAMNTLVMKLAKIPKATRKIAVNVRNSSITFIIILNLILPLKTICTTTLPTSLVLLNMTCLSNPLTTLDLLLTTERLSTNV